MLSRFYAKRGHWYVWCSACLLLWASLSWATTIILNFDTLPSAQGWTYISDGAPETSIFSVSDGVLTQNTLAGPYSVERYQILDIVDNSPFTIQMRARVIAESGSSSINSYGFCIVGRTGAQAFGIGLGTNRIEDQLGTALTIDNTQFHDYRLEATPNVGYRFFIDDVLVLEGPPRYVDYPNLIHFGDCTRGTGAHAEITSYTFSQADPVVTVEIDVKPGSDPNCFNLNGHGVIPVAINGTASFDATDIDVDSLLFDGLMVRVRGNKGPLCSIEDWNNDGNQDMVCHFEDDPTNWTGGDSTATLTGELIDGTPIEGTDSICIVP